MTFANDTPPNLNDLTGTSGNPDVPIEEINNTIKDIDIDLPTIQEKTRSKLAMGLVGLLGTTLVLFGVYIFLNKDSKDSEGLKNSKELIVLIWTSEVTLVSGALGFYFGSNKGS